MMRLLFCALCALCALCASALAQQPAAARANTACDMVVDHAQRLRRLTNSDGTETIHVGGAFRAHCENDSTQLQSDSMHYVQATGVLQLVNRVRFRDSISTLDADHVTYYLRQERMIARGNVYTRNLRNGSDMRGPHLDYSRVAERIRDTMEIYATGRPTITFYPQSDSTRPAAERPLPFIIVGDNVRMRHTDRMWGSGRVTIDRPDMSARADSAFLNLADTVGFLIGAPVVTGHDTTTGADSTQYRLTGQRIRFDLTGKQQVRHVLTSGDAVADGTDWRLTADTLDMDVDSGRIQRTQAWGGQDNRPVAVSGPSTIVADSMDILMPMQRMERVWAWGSARATSRDTVAAARDTSADRDDWLTGDSLRAEFAERASPTDSTKTRTEISQVTSYGNARAFYHVENQRDSLGQRGINYSRGDRISIALRERRVQTVDIVGRVDGVYLEPLPPGADTLQPDTTRPAQPQPPTPTRPKESHKRMSEQAHKNPLEQVRWCACPLVRRRQP